MRFDLEIPSNNTDIAFIKEGNNIPNNIFPVLYHNPNNINLFPGDFISAEVSYYPREFVNGGFDVVNGPEIKNPKSDRFILTNIVKYSSIDGKEIPLFYKHVINESVQDNAIKIIDSIGAIVSKDLYTIKTKENTTEIYINEQNHPLFVEYVSSSSIKKSLLNLRQVYEEASWQDINGLVIDNGKYIYRNDIIITSYDGKLYIAYKSDTKLFRKPYGNIEDPWYIGVLNADFKIEKNNIIYRYWIPEYYLQELDTEFRYKLIENKKCKKISDGFIQTEYPIAKNNTDSLIITVYDFYTKELKHAFTPNVSLTGRKYNDSVFYSQIVDFTYNGIISLPVILEDSDIVYATFYTDESYYEYNGIDIKSAFNKTTEYIAFYIKPDILDTESSVAHALIGNDTTSNFKTLDEYNEWIDNNNCYPIAIVSIINPYIDNNTKYIPVYAYGNKIKDKYSASKIHIDVFYNDIINEDIILPTNDTLVAHINIKKYLDNEMISYTIDNGNIALNDYGNYLVNKINDTISKNLDASTYPILDINIKEN